MKRTPKPFAEVLKRKRGKLTQREAADKIGVPLPTYVNWEQTRNVPDALKRAAILARL